MNKRNIMLSLIDKNTAPVEKNGYTPAAFFLHFDPAFHRGQPAVDKHLEYFRYTGMDFVKIQFEHQLPQEPSIQKPEDWVKMPFHKLDFYEEPLRVVEGLVKAVKSEALVILTLYSPFMMAGQVVGSELLNAHIRENPQAVQRGMQVITDSLMGFVKECIRLGLDGFYTSTQGGEAGRFDNIELFNQCVRPYDLALMEEINRSCIFNILHVCDYHLPYSGLSNFVDYPGQVVNASLDLADGRHISAKEVADMFGRPFMGGIERKGVIAHGSQAEIRREVETALKNAPERSILAADCTVPGDTPWDNLRLAISIAHGQA